MHDPYHVHDHDAVAFLYHQVNHYAFPSTIHQLQETRLRNDGCLLRALSKYGDDICMMNYSTPVLFIFLFIVSEHDCIINEG